MSAQLVENDAPPIAIRRATCSLAAGDLAEALAHCAEAVMDPGNGVMPILSHVQIKTVQTEDGDALFLYATDLEWGVSVGLPLPYCTSAWEAAVPAQRAAELLKTFPANDVVSLTRVPPEGPVIEVIVTSGRSSTRLKAIACDDFPPAPAAEPQDLPYFAAEGETLARALALTEPFTSRVAERMALNGVAVSFQKDGTEVEFLATNTQVVSRYAYTDENEHAAEVQAQDYPTEAVLIPARACRQIAKAAKACGQDRVWLNPVGDRLRPRGVRATFPRHADQEGATEEDGIVRKAEVVIFARVLEGIYPDVTGRLLARLSDEPETTVRVRPRALTGALSRVAAVAERSQSGYTLVSLTPLVEEGAIRVHARGVQVGEGTDVLSADVTGKTAQEHLFNLGNLRAVLRALTPEMADADAEVVIALRPKKPAVFSDAVTGSVVALFPMAPAGRE